MLPDEKKISELVTEKLIEKKLTITFMESCTAGLLGSNLTDTAGASEIFKGSFVTYSNEEKIAQGVKPEIIEKFGVYSKECARAMAEAAQNHFKTDISIGITGTTGNVDPNNSDSILGTAFCCIRIRKIENEEETFENFDLLIEENVKNISRKQIKQLYADNVFDGLWKILEDI